jgi:hypothetical protein
MESVFPRAAGVSGQFFVGHRKTDAKTEQVGTVVIKRRYRLDNQRLTPEFEAPGILLEDQPDNLLSNPDFSVPDRSREGPARPLDWQVEAGVDLTFPARGQDDQPALGVSGVEGGRITQVLELDQPLAGEHFAFSVELLGDEKKPTVVTGLQLEAGQAVICRVPAITLKVPDPSNPLVPALPVRVHAIGRWPESLGAKALTVVLPVPQSAVRVRYQRAQVERRGHVTAWNDPSERRLESDLQPYKPAADIVVLDGTDEPGVHTLLVNGELYLKRNIEPPDGAPEGSRLKAVFGWASVLGERGQERGEYPNDPNAYPLRDPLPKGFDNSYYNGQLRAPARALLLERLRPGSVIAWQLEGNDVARLRLGEERFSARYFFESAGTLMSEDIPMRCDTLIWFTEQARVDCLWRGTWPLLANDRPVGSYRRVEVTLEEGRS